MDQDPDLIDSVVTRTAKVHNPSPAANLLCGDQEVVYANPDYQRIMRRPEMKGKKAVPRVSMRLDKSRVLPNTPKDRFLNLVKVWT